MLFTTLYKQRIQLLFSNNIDEVFLYWKGRIGLFALLKVMGVKAGDEVILPAYTCVVVPNAIIYLGARPVYVDVSRETFNIDVEQVENAITKNTRVIICQNTYGLSTDLEILNQIAKKYGLYTIEDCTHGFGGTYAGIPNGLSCDAAFFSTQWNKPFSTGVGGFVITKDTHLSSNLSKLNHQLVKPNNKDLLNLRLLYFVKKYLLNSYTYWPLVHAYRWLSFRGNKILGSSSAIEVQTTIIPSEYFKGFSEIQAKEGLKNLAKLSTDIKKRKETSRLYSDFLGSNNKTYVAEKWFNNHSFLVYPLLVNDRKKFMGLAKKSNIELGEWFTSPLHPVESNFSLWEFDEKNFPIATDIADHIVNLPTTAFNTKLVLSFLEKNIDHIK